MSDDPAAQPTPPAPADPPGPDTFAPVNSAPVNSAPVSTVPASCLPVSSVSDGPVPEVGELVFEESTSTAPAPARVPPVPAEPTPWGTGLTVSAFVAAVVGVAVVVLSLGVAQVHPFLAAGLNLVAVGGLAPTLWTWRRVAVLRWFVLGVGIGVVVAWVTLAALALRGG